MENKKLGILLLVIGLAVFGVFLYYSSFLQGEGDAMKCYPTQDCLGIEKTLAFSHVVIGIASFVFALGFYLLFFNRTEKAILDKLENDKKEKTENEKFEYVMRALDNYEQKVIKFVKEQPGITQSTLRIKADMSKAKLSYVLQELEKRGLIKRIEKGKTLAIYLKI